jgi:hypothetical protein
MSQGGIIMCWKHKVWYVFLALLLLNGCEKKDEFSAQTQAATFIQENPAILGVVEPREKLGEELIHVEPGDEKKPSEKITTAQPAEVIKVGLTLKYDPPTNDRTVYVDRNTTVLKFIKIAITGVEGLNQLEFLDTVVFTFASKLHNFSFLTEVPRLKRLFIDFPTENIDWSFIEQLPELEVLYVVKSYHQPEISIDLKNNKSLEYIGFQYGILEMFPTLHNVPYSLKFLNLEGNKIASLPIDFDIYSHTTVFMKLNPFEVNAITPDNVTMEWSSRVLGEKYYPPFYLPDISDLSY